MFTSEEKKGLRKVVEAGIRVRATMVASPAEDLPVLAAKSEALNKTAHYLVGAVVGRNPQERDALAAAGREVYLQKAWEHLDLAQEEVAIDRTLPYEDIFPEDDLTIPGRAIGPHGPYVEVQTHLWRSATHYGQDAVSNLVDALQDQEPCPDGAAAREALEAMLRAQDTVLRAVARLARVGLNREEEVEAASNPRVFALRPFKDLTEDAPRRWFHAQAALSRLVATGALGQVWAVAVSQANLHTGDSWKQGNWGAWAFNKIPETGI